jgi:hypothetical protein
MDPEMEIAKLKDRVSRAEREIELLKRKRLGVTKPKSQAAIRAELLALKGQPAPINNCILCEGEGQCFILGEGTIKCECMAEFGPRYSLWLQANAIRYKQYASKEPKKQL